MFWYFNPNQTNETGGWRPYGAPFIFVMSSMNFYNDIVTAVVAFVTQSWLNHYIIFDKLAPVGVASPHSHALFSGQVDLVFNAILCAACVVLNKMFASKNEDAP